MSMLKGFRDFIMRGNIIDLAVGVTVGVAFTALVTAFANDFINPLIKVFGGGNDLAGVWRVHHQSFAWADFINAVINFLIVAAILYFLVVLPVNKLNGLRKRGVPAEVEAPLSEDIVLLREIRDALLVANATQATAPSQRSGEEATDSADS